MEYGVSIKRNKREKVLEKVSLKEGLPLIRFYCACFTVRR